MDAMGGMEDFKRDAGLLLMIAIYLCLKVRAGVSICSVRLFAASLSLTASQGGQSENDITVGAKKTENR